MEGEAAEFADAIGVEGEILRAFGAEDLGQYASPDGVVHHATLKIGTSHLEMGEANFVECSYCDRRFVLGADHEVAENELVAPGVYEGSGGH